MNRLIKGCILLLLFIDLQGSQTLQSSGVSVLSCNNTPSDNIQIQRRQTILRLNGSIRQERSLRRLERKKYVSNVVRKSRFRSKKKEEEEPAINSPPVSKILGLIIFYSLQFENKIKQRLAEPQTPAPAIRDTPGEGSSNKEEEEEGEESLDTGSK